MNVDIDHLLIAEHHNSRTQMEQTLGLGVLCTAPARMQTFEGGHAGSARSELIGGKGPADAVRSLMSSHYKPRSLRKRIMGLNVLSTACKHATLFSGLSRAP